MAYKLTLLVMLALVVQNVSSEGPMVIGGGTFLSQLIAQIIEKAKEAAVARTKMQPEMQVVTAPQPWRIPQSEDSPSVTNDYSPQTVNTVQVGGGVSSSYSNSVTPPQEALQKDVPSPLPTEAPPPASSVSEQKLQEQSPSDVSSEVESRSSIQAQPENPHIEITIQQGNQDDAAAQKESANQVTQSDPKPSDSDNNMNVPKTDVPNNTVVPADQEEEASKEDGKVEDDNSNNTGSESKEQPKKPEDEVKKEQADKKPMGGRSRFWLVGIVPPRRRLPSPQPTASEPENSNSKENKCPMEDAPQPPKSNENSITLSRVLRYNSQKIAKIQGKIVTSMSTLEIVAKKSFGHNVPSPATSIM